MVLLYINRRLRGMALLAGGLVALWLLLQLAVVQEPLAEPVDQDAEPALSKPMVGLGLVVTWGDRPVRRALTELNEHGLHASFFPSAVWARVHPQLADAMTAAGHEVGTAGGHQTDYTLFPERYVRQQLEHGVDAVTHVSGTRPQLAVLPHNRHNAAVRQIAADLDLLVIDAAVQRLAPHEEITAAARRLASQVNGQAMLLLDLSGDDPRAGELVMALVRELEERGKTVGPVDRVLAD